MKFFYVFLSVVIFSLFSLFSLARADFTSTSFKLENPINIIGGGQSSSTSFQYISTTGQLTQGQSTSTSFAQNAGFLYFPEEASVTPAVAGTSTGSGAGVSSVVVLIPGLNVDCTIADFNCDGHVNLLDLSILLFYMKRTGPTNSLFDLNGDGRIGLVDISIMLYYWDE